MKQQDPKPSEGERIARALESIAGSLAKLANPPMVMGADGEISLAPGFAHYVRMSAVGDPSSFDPAARFVPQHTEEDGA